ncbi:MAG: hypothetical protein II712_03470, partial [Erysipelotrichaceae bacterium]|nr:hypothetical protein [Erysipelotrichaceae bacterium]
MTAKNYRFIMFDLDGTLLPMDIDIFTRTYFGLMAKKVAPLGYEPKSLVNAIWSGKYVNLKQVDSAPAA